MRNKKNILSLATLIVIVVLIVVMVALHAGRSSPTPLPAATVRPTAKVIVEEREVEKLVEKLVEVEVVKKISSAEISSGLNDMGLLITQEYYFTGVTGGSNKVDFLGREWDFTETGFLASYDGVVTAGVNFTRIRVVKNDTARTILVSVPRAQIIAVDIDPESFQLHYEKNSIFTDLSAEDFNASLVELERLEREKALERGILEKADENAEKLIRGFIDSLVDTGDYTIFFDVQGGTEG